MLPDPKPGYAALRRHRASTAGAEYFITINTQPRRPGLQEPSLTEQLLLEWRKLEAEKTWLVRCGVVMPDHLHLLMELGSAISLSGCIRLGKGRLSPTMRAAGLNWQEGYYEHLMRENEDRLPVFLYIYLNPYKAGLVTKDQPGTGFYCAPADWGWFSELTDRELPFAEWLV